MRRNNQSIIRNARNFPKKPILLYRKCSKAMADRSFPFSPKDTALSNNFHQFPPQKIYPFVGREIDVHASQKNGVACESRRRESGKFSARKLDCERPQRDDGHDVPRVPLLYSISSPCSYERTIRYSSENG